NCNNATAVVRFKLFFILLNNIFVSFVINSNISFLQAPQVLTASVVSAITAIFSNDFSPSEIALKIAFLSAQHVKENEEFSILQPVSIVPDFPSNAAPTL